MYNIGLMLPLKMIRMKIHKYRFLVLNICLFISVMMFLSSCNRAENPYFGRFSSIQEQELDALSRQRAKIPDGGFSSYKERDKYDEKERAIFKKYENKMKKESMRIAGRKIPVTIEENIPFRIVDSLTVLSDTAVLLGAPCRVEGVLEATRDIYLSQVGDYGGSVPRDMTYPYLYFRLPLYLYHTYGEQHALLQFERMYTDKSFNTGYYMCIYMGAKDSISWVKINPLDGYEVHHGYRYNRSFEGSFCEYEPEDNKGQRSSSSFNGNVLCLSQYDFVEPEKVPLILKGERVRIKFHPIDETRIIDFNGYLLSFTPPDPNNRNVEY